MIRYLSISLFLPGTQQEDIAQLPLQLECVFGSGLQDRAEVMLTINPTVWF
jgi:hypothetical protein